MLFARRGYFKYMADHISGRSPRTNFHLVDRLSLKSTGGLEYEHAFMQKLI